MDSKLFFSFFLFVSSWVFVGFSQNVDPVFQTLQASLQNSSLQGAIQGSQQVQQSSLQDSILGAIQGSGTVGSVPCMQKLLPCQPFLHSPEAPLASCCLPLKEMLSDDSQCLCTIFDNAEILKSLNLTQDEALKLPKACGAKVDLSLCKKGATSPTSSPATPSTLGTLSNSSSSNSSTNNSTTSAAYGISHFGGSSFVALLVASIISGF